jgi:hypothetical protein
VEVFVEGDLGGLVAWIVGYGLRGVCHATPALGCVRQRVTAGIASTTMPPGSGISIA